MNKSKFYPSLYENYFYIENGEVKQSYNDGKKEIEGNIYRTKQEVLNILNNKK